MASTLIAMASNLPPGSPEDFSGDGSISIDEFAKLVASPKLQFWISHWVGKGMTGARRPPRVQVDPPLVPIGQT